jgi:hypothetical protein
MRSDTARQLKARTGGSSHLGRTLFVRLLFSDPWPQRSEVELQLVDWPEERGVRGYSGPRHREKGRAAMPHALKLISPDHRHGVGGLSSARITPTVIAAAPATIATRMNLLLPDVGGF